MTSREKIIGALNTLTREELIEYAALNTIFGRKFCQMQGANCAAVEFYLDPEDGFTEAQAERATEISLKIQKRITQLQTESN
jgi:hypothetical protein